MNKEKIQIEEPKIVNIESLINIRMDIPVYQRPYRWKENTAMMLLNDILEAYNKNFSEYRIGTLILHNNGQTYEIVDGQQRITTLSLILKSLGYNDSLSLFNIKYKKDSRKAIKKNYLLINRKISDLKNSKNKEDISNIKKYILDKCSFVKIVTNSEQEAFQFFDSQNSRGKALSPHDLLKSYHLREMNEETDEVKKKVVERWENIDDEELSILFKDYLYPIIRWYRKKDGLGYDSSKIEIFKGIRRENNYYYSIYHKASHLFIEDFNSKNYDELIGNKKINQFILTTPIIAGRRFFDYTVHYNNLLKEVNKIISIKINNDLLPTDLTGDKYIKRLLNSILLMIADKFTIETLDNMRIINLMYTWAYSLRLVMHSVYETTINNYAIGKHDRINQIPIFEYISEIMSPDKIEQIILNDIKKINTSKNKGVKSKYKKIADYLNKINREGFVEDD